MPINGPFSLWNDVHIARTKCTICMLLLLNVFSSEPLALNEVYCFDMLIYCDAMMLLVHICLFTFTTNDKSDNQLTPFLVNFITFFFFFCQTFMWLKVLQHWTRLEAMPGAKQGIFKGYGDHQKWCRQQDLTLNEETAIPSMIILFTLGAVILGAAQTFISVTSWLDYTLTFIFFKNYNLKRAIMSCSLVSNFSQRVFLITATSWHTPPSPLEFGWRSHTSRDKSLLIWRSVLRAIRCTS